MLPKNQDERLEETKLVLDRETGKYKHVPISEAHKYGDGANKPNTDSCALEPLSDAEVEALATLPAGELIALVRASLGAAKYIRYGLLTQAERMEAARMKLYDKGMTAEEVREIVPALDKWMDRTEGKVSQSVDLNVDDKRLENLSTDRLLRLESELARLTGCDALVIAPMPKKLEDESGENVN